MKGRKPKPNELKIFDGNPGKRPLKDVPKPDKCATCPEPPEWLGEYGQSYWKENAPHLFKLGILRVLDVPAFEQLCIAWNDFQVASRAIAKEGQVLEDERGKTYKNPRVTVRTEAFNMLRTLQAGFGMIPTERMRIEAPEKKHDPAQEFLG